jgi:cobalt-zinc-cadmium efflux system membrane fusion protein
MKEILMNRTRIALLGGALIVLAFAAIFFWPRGASTEVRETEANTVPALVVNLSDERIRAAKIGVAKVELGAAAELLLPATVAASPASSAVIDARAAGVVRSISKTLGDYVRKGEAVARIESGEAAALASERAAAQARVNELSAAYEREKRLFDQNVTARQDLEAAQANLAVARSELARASAAFAAAGVSGDGRSLAVVSPLSGRITQAPIVLGSYVAAGDPLYHVVNPDSMQVEVAVPAGDAARIRPGDEAMIVTGDGREIGTRVRSVTPALDPESRSATAVLLLPPAVPGLQPGAFLQARLRPSGEVVRGAIAVPESAVQSIDGGDHVFVRTAKGFVAQPVQAGDRSGGMVTILSGIEPGTVIAAQNAFLLKAELGKGSVGED